MASVPFRPLASSQGRDGACGLQAGSVGPPGFSLPLIGSAPGSGTSTISHLRWCEELDEFHEPWNERRGRRDHYGDGFALRCLELNQECVKFIIKIVIPPWLLLTAKKQVRP